MLKHIKDMGEEHITRLATRLLSNEAFVLAVQRIASRTLRTREQIEGGLRAVLSSLAVPTSEDLDEIGDRLADIEERVDELARVLASHQEAGKRSARKGRNDSRRKASRRTADL